MSTIVYTGNCMWADFRAFVMKVPIVIQLVVVRVQLAFIVAKALWKLR